MHSLSGTYTVLHNFAGDNDGGTPQGPPIQGSDGNLYGSTHGSPGASVVYKYSKSGTYSVVYTFTGTQGLALTGPLLQANDGNLYGTAVQGGANGVGTVFKMTTTGTVLGYFSFKTTGKSGYFPIGGLIQALDGNFHGVTSAGGASGFGTIFKMTPKVSMTTLYSS